ncbi:hypothetical protein SERLA73DRAFT_73624 [Serpula lacrymans var. lacrymans S7.3]|uniref:Onanonoxo-7-onima-8-eninoihtemlysoneda n=2 Tax=Serpula lacrymans var. lacrymans TaxID=341189 RepID=F8PYT7_SERL3|nr:uncharacterized protein SERLADRAFT_438251 [Serpula lacrymans var. lacrymans S7.9]EGN99050.1 hypothetical protein SERLA73DRAFT_73624 [Serpula lacrymans var. lacrymans S7.3]EGO24625.1 hypothetical protein SERLADRAFT_438251 [Serpula lacrymans var. lacrymans S7.9]
MSTLFKNLRVHQIFGANTDVGKTILTSALVRASTIKNNTVYYLKPVSTGAPEDADDGHIQRFAGPQKSLVHTECLFRFGDPVSPHLAVKMASDKNGETVRSPTDETFVNSIASYIRRCAMADRMGHMYIETAGGVHSPTLSGTTQADAYRPLFLPTLLVGDGKLGGISSTISSYEALLLRGYIIDAILLFRDEYYRNFEYLTPYFAERGVRVVTVEPPPPRAEDTATNVSITEEYYSRITSTSGDGLVYDLLSHLDDCHSHRIEELQSMRRRTLDTIWWPFVQHGLVKSEEDVTVIDSAWSDFFSVYDAPKGTPGNSNKNTSLLEPQLDGSASWWTQALGHAHPSLTQAAAHASGRYGHVMFPQATHLPALKLAERLVHAGPGKGWASRAFFSDDGSTGMEVALKMALRSFAVKAGTTLSSSAKKNLGIIGLKGSYHGDTIGAMDACEEGVYTCEWHNAKGYWFEPPTISIRQGEVTVSLPPSISSSSDSSNHAMPSLSSVYDVESRLHTSLATVYRRHIESTLSNLMHKGQQFAALVLEPLVMGAGGMIFIDPLFQRVMIDVVRDPKLFPARDGPQDLSQGLPVIYDEVFIGLYRLGFLSSTSLLGVYPDISVNAKILTGGLVPMAVTMASESIFQAFWSNHKTDALLHGHSYTAHPIGCEVANKTLDLLEKMTDSEQWKQAKQNWVEKNLEEGSSEIWSFWDRDFIHSLSHLDVVNEVMALGTVLAIKVKDKQAGYGSHSAQKLLQSIKFSPSDDPLLSSAPGGAPFGIHFRTLGDVAYFMTSLNTPRATIESIENRLWNTLSNAGSP